MSATREMPAPVSSICGHPTGFVVGALTRIGRDGWVQGLPRRSRAAARIAEDPGSQEGREIEVTENHRRRNL